MADIYQAKRRQFQQKLKYKHHAAWVILCAIMLMIMLTLWANVQSLQRQNTALNRQLASANSIRTNTTCQVIGQWGKNTTKQLSVATEVGDRQFLVHTPKDFTDEQYYPLLLFYPGRGATAPAAQAAYGLDELPAIVVYPFPTTGPDGTTAWEGAPYSSTADDISFTAGILDKLQGDLCIDRKRLYVAGLSNGGGFATLLSCSLPDRFAAYAIISGAMYYPTSNCQPKRPLPLITIHGTYDPIVPYAGSLSRQLPPIHEWTRGRAEQNGCKTTSIAQNIPSIHTTTWTDCDQKSVVQSVAVQGGGHTWGQVSNDYLWAFLSQFKL